jgi:predicted small lipoprotein YifL
MSAPLRTARAALAAAALLALVMTGALQGCGLKGPLYLPQQKKTKVPANPTNPAPDTPEAPPAPTPPASAPSSQS